MAVDLPLLYALLDVVWLRRIVMFTPFESGIIHVAIQCEAYKLRGEVARRDSGAVRSARNGFNKMLNKERPGTPIEGALRPTTLEIDTEVQPVEVVPLVDLVLRQLFICPSATLRSKVVEAGAAQQP